MTARAAVRRQRRVVAQAEGLVVKWVPQIATRRATKRAAIDARDSVRTMVTAAVAKASSWVARDRVRDRQANNTAIGPRPFAFSMRPRARPCSVASGRWATMAPRESINHAPVAMNAADATTFGLSRLPTRMTTIPMVRSAPASNGSGKRERGASMNDAIPNARGTYDRGMSRRRCPSECGVLNAAAATNAAPTATASAGGPEATHDKPNPRKKKPSVRTAYGGASAVNRAPATHKFNTASNPVTSKGRSLRPPVGGRGVHPTELVSIRRCPSESARPSGERLSRGAERVYSPE